MSRRGLIRLIIAAGVLVGLVGAAWVGVFLWIGPGARAFRVPVSSMEPTIRAGESLIADMRWYKTHEPKRGDVIIFQLPNLAPYIKRVIAIGGDTIRLRNGQPVINGARLDEPYVMQGQTEFPSSGPYHEIGEVTVPPNSYFVLGDNRAHSFDSRYVEFGMVPRDRIIGKPILIYRSSESGRIGKIIR